jgi:hypothetical protein
MLDFAPHHFCINDGGTMYDVPATFGVSEVPFNARYVIFIILPIKIGTVNTGIPKKVTGEGWHVLVI